MITRYPDWQVQLTALLREYRRAEFDPGVLDCGMFVANAVHAMTGFDPAEELRGYATLEEGQAWARKLGYADHVDVIAKQLPEIPVHEAGAGDLAVVEADGACALGLVQGRLIYVMTERGLALADRALATKAFRV